MKIFLEAHAVNVPEDEPKLVLCHDVTGLPEQSTLASANKALDLSDSLASYKLSDGESVIQAFAPDSIEAAANDLDDQMAGKPYVLKRHLCTHDGTGGPCKLEDW